MIGQHPDGRANDLPHSIGEEDVNSKFTIYAPVGCDQCAGGYKGRVGVYQVVKISEEMGRIIMEGGNSIQISDMARAEGFNDLRRSALMKACQGLTSLEEVNRVTKD